MADRTHRPYGPAALDAVASPARLEILGALGHGPATTKMLAARLGRSRQSLYYHLDLMVRAGIVAADAPDGDRHERRFRLAGGRLAVGVRAASRQDRVAAAKATCAILRAAEREASAAYADLATRVDGAHCQIAALRGKARLTGAGLRRAHKLIGELQRLFRDDGASRGPVYSLTIALAPARDAAAATEE